MNKNSVQLIWTPDHITQAAEQFAEMLIANTTPDERETIYIYGRHMLAGAQPSKGCTARFAATMFNLAPQMPGYSDRVKALCAEPETISLLQSNIALYVLLNETAVQS